MHIEENRPLAPFTTFGIGGPARWFVEAASEPEIVEAVEWARVRGVPLFVLGGGSNLLISDAGFDGLVLRITLCGVSVLGTGGAARVYRVAAGEPWDDFVQRSVDDNCSGIECLAGIPGTVGGAPVQNVGAYGQEVASVIERVRAFDLQAHAWTESTAAECDFAYRRSRFNSSDRGRFLITSVDYRLTPGGAPALHYQDLKQAFLQSEPSLAEVAATVRRIRRAKGMLLVDGDSDCRSAGSFFKNPVISEAHFKRVAAGGSAVHFPAGPGRIKLPAAWLIEQAGFYKGYSLGAAGISSRHTLALINRSGATAAEILELAAQITDAVEARFGIRLEMEPVLVGFE